MTRIRSDSTGKRIRTIELSKKFQERMLQWYGQVMRRGKYCAGRGWWR